MKLLKKVVVIKVHKEMLSLTHLKWLSAQKDSIDIQDSQFSLKKAKKAQAVVMLLRTQLVWIHSFWVIYKKIMGMLENIWITKIL